ncbi:MAG TPA: ARMT1-like domain-containing protein [Phycisphaerae bacterium]|jgi:uncharacterized protein with ATP-grasp and redox domains|nr:DUF89 family protein [Phycisphaerae bacterium]HOB76334.1 ARMT1-like domain-containing protein [Phycisphaerae bacterium]HOJ55499.1 ARMT1-like domain-containing protein [Phycisphaerae bacterium]HOL26008.1 ARMT1-like domain-containing protein [Phycisphaerae bacterium]HPP22734.1 ARMT1-like domain-containing protein [Phycisphaerae bacterium]
MAVLCQLANPEHYRPFDWSLVADPADLAYWLGLFAGFPRRIEKLLRADGLAGADFESRWRAFCEEYAAGMARWQADPLAGGEVTTIALCEFRQAMLIKHGFPDPYAGIKARENEAAAELYPGVIERIDRLPAEQRWETLLRALFAGNMFDMGSPLTIDLYHTGGIDFLATLDRIPPRPWFIDHADALHERLWPKPAWRQILFFVDNAGSDIVLGAIPVIRELARRGPRVVVAANTTPALNDITIDELNVLLRRLAEVDPVLAGLLEDGRIATVASGCGIPLIDLSRVSDECNAAAAQSDLIVLEGMGRGVESNWRQTFKCDVWRVALLKDESVVKWVGAHLWDPVCRFDPAPTAH